MKRQNQSSKSQSQPVPLRLHEATLLEVKRAGEKLRGQKDSEVIRLALEIGLAALAEVEYDVPKLIAQLAVERTAHRRPSEKPADEDHAPVKLEGKAAAGKARQAKTG